jgi:hypothetical protein
MENSSGSHLHLRPIPTAHVPLVLPQIPILIRQPFFQHLRHSLHPILSRQHLVRYTTFIYQICVCIAEEQSPDDVCVAFGSCEME